MLSKISTKADSVIQLIRSSAQLSRIPHPNIRVNSSLYSNAMASSDLERNLQRNSHGEKLSLNGGNVCSSPLSTSTAYGFGKSKMQEHTSSNELFLKKIGPIYKNKIKYRLYYIIRSRFHSEGNLRIHKKSICDILSIVLKNTKHEKLVGCLRTLEQERQRVMVEYPDVEVFHEENFFDGESTHAYYKAYSQLDTLFEPFLLHVEELPEKHPQKHLLSCLSVEIFGHYSLMQYYHHFLFKYLGTNYEDPKEYRKNYELDSLILGGLIQNQYSRKNPYVMKELHRFAKRFYLNKAHSILSTTYVFNKKELQSLSEDERAVKILNLQLKILRKIEWLLMYTPKSINEVNFMEQLLASSESVFQYRFGPDDGHCAQIKLQNLIYFLYLMVRSMVLDTASIQKIEQCLKTAIKAQVSASPEHIVMLMEAYAEIGSIPTEIYEFYVKSELQGCCGNDEQVYTGIKYYSLIEPDDPKLLYRLLDRLEVSYQQKGRLEIKKNNMIQLHYFVHNLWIRHQIKMSSVVRYILAEFCTPYNDRHSDVIQKITQRAKRTHLHDRRYRLSPCCQHVKKKTEDKEFRNKGKNKTEQSFLGNMVFRAVDDLNSQDKESFYEVIKGFSFCSYEIDYMILRWGSFNRQHLLSCVDLEGEGIQYSYITNIDQRNFALEETLSYDFRQIQYTKRRKYRKELLEYYGIQLMGLRYHLVKSFDHKQVFMSVKECLKNKLATESQRERTDSIKR